MIDSTPLKRCSKCKRELPATKAYFYRHSGQSDGFHSSCKECEGHPFGVHCNHIESERDGYKVCTKCNQELPATRSYFKPDKLGKYGVQSVCRNCCTKQQNEYRTNHLERERERSREHARRKAHPEDLDQWLVEWQAKQQLKVNGLKVCTACHRQLPANTVYFAYRKQRTSDGLSHNCRECHNKRSVEWVRCNPEKSRVATIRRRARRKSLPDCFDSIDWQHALSYFNGCCAVCGRQLNDLFGEHTAAMDHWIPLNSPDCPGTVPTNIVPLCHGVGGCNNRKSDREPLLWLNQTCGKRKAKQILDRIEAYFASLD